MKKKINLINKEETKQFVVTLYARVFEILNCITPRTILTKLLHVFYQPAPSYDTVEIWVLANTFISVIISILYFLWPDNLLMKATLAYGAWRSFEIIIVQINVLFFDWWRAKKTGNNYSLRSYNRTSLLLIHNYIEIVFWFMAVLFYLQSMSYITLNNFSYISTFRISLLSMACFSSGEIKDPNAFALIILAAQSLVGIFLTILMLSRFISLIPAPETKDKAEK